MAPSSFIRSADGTRLAVYDSGGTGPVVLAIHGYPDNASVWNGLVGELSGRFRVVRYDVRGCGASDKPRARSAYRIERLIDDLAAVVDAVGSAGVHLVGHDWGSVQAWPALTDERIRPRLRDFASISGPSLDHMAQWLRGAVRTQPRLVAKQAIMSAYVGLFQIPRLPEFLIDRKVLRAAVRRRTSGMTHTAPQRSDADYRNGLELYRANLFTALRRPAPARIEIPVLVLLLAADEALDPRVCAQAPAPWVARMTTRTLPGGHWLVVQRPQQVARCLTEFWAAGAA